MIKPLVFPLIVMYITKFIFLRNHIKIESKYFLYLSVHFNYTFSNALNLTNPLHSAEIAEIKYLSLKKTP